MKFFSERPWACVVAEIIGGVVSGAIIGIPLTFVAGSVITPRPGSFDDVVAALAGLYIGYVVGVVIGVLLVARLLNQRGPWWAAAAGSVSGAVIVILFAMIAGGAVPSIVQILYFSFVPTLSAVVFTRLGGRG